MHEQPRIPLGTWPTPVVELPRVSRALGVEVWAKLEHRCGAWGATKVRKLEYILGRAEADGIGRLVGFGAGTSSWTSALAFHAVPLGFEVQVRLTANEIPPEYQDLYRRVGVSVVRRSPARWYLESNLTRFRPVLGATRWLPLGGSGCEGDLGTSHLGAEIAEAISAQELPFPRKVFVATGTAGTAAGIAVGAQTRGLGLDVVCVRVSPWPYGTRAHVAALARSLRRRIGVEGRTSFRLQGDAMQAAPGYARSNERSLEASEMAGADGLALDDTYAAKAFASLVAAARRGEPGPYLFLHTSPGSPPASIR